MDVIGKHTPSLRALIIKKIQSDMISVSKKPEFPSTGTLVPEYISYGLRKKMGTKAGISSSNLKTANSQET